MSTRTPTLLLLASVCLVALGCGPEERVRQYRAPKDEPPPRRSEAASPGAPRSAGAGETIHWTLPGGWSRSAEQRPMRFATLVSGGEDPLEVSVIRLGGDGGGLLANVNRWRGQMELGPINESQLSEYAVKLPNDQTDGLLIRIEGQSDPPQQMLVAVLFRPDDAWFFKAVAAPAVAEQHNDAFLELIRSVHFAADTRQTVAASSLPQGATWSAPDDWETDATSTGSMRLGSFKVHGGGQTADVSVTRFQGDVGGWSLTLTAGAVRSGWTPSPTWLSRRWRPRRWRASRADCWN